MRLRLTLVAPTVGAAAVDVVVEAPVGSHVAVVAAQLVAAAGAPQRDAGTPLYVGHRRLADDTVLGLPPLVDGAVVTVGGPSGVPAPRGVLELHVVSGPDAGGVHRLGPGTHAVGRAAGAAIRVDDPALSRAHAELTVATDGVTVRDSASTNGTTVLTDDSGTGTARTGAVPLPVDGRVRVGESTLRLATPDAATATTVPDGEGHLLVNRPPRLLPPVTPVEVSFPAAPVLREAPRFPAVMLALPLVTGALLYAVTASAMYLLFVLLSPLMLLGNYVSDRVTGRRGNARAVADHEVATAAAQARVDAALVEERERLHRSSPDAAQLLLAACGPRPSLWERRRADADFLTARLGTGTLPSSVVVRDESAPTGTPRRTTPTLEDVPVTVSLRDCGVVGLAGPPERLLGLARSVLAQVVGWQSPRDVSVVLLADADAHADAADWAWAGWLPHLTPSSGQSCTVTVGFGERQVAGRVAELVTLLDARGGDPALARAGPWPGPVTVVVLDGARALRALPGVARLLVEGPPAGVLTVCLEERPESLPAECRAVAVVHGDVATRLTLHRDDADPVVDAVADLASPAWAERVARALAPLRDATPDGADGGLPSVVRLLDLLPHAADPDALVETWTRAPRSTVAVLGVGPDGPYAVDLRRDGPHALVAGTTGSGKSELLQTLVASLAAANRPDEMSFLLVDYKGGSAFRDCARLPHTVGLVTDLDGHLTGRALASLTAELRRRERLLAAAGCSDIDGYAGLPRLVIVVDEFATLAEELPDFVSGLVGIARRGRSLGVHLVLATQRPAGVVTAEIRANTGLRLALRVTDPTDSVDVVDARDAAGISPGTPGRACVRTDAGPVVTFQTARVAGRPVVEGRQPTVHPLTWPPSRESPADEPNPTGAGPTDLARLVDAAGRAARQLGTAAAPSPWLPPLPDVVTVADLPPVSRWELPVGLVDVPQEQRRGVLALDLAAGEHLLVAGAAGSGRTGVLRAVAAGVARHAVRDVHVHGIDTGSGALAGVAALPHCGALVGRDETARGDRLLTRLLTELRRRQELLARTGFGSVTEQRAASPPEEHLPYLVLLLDSWEGFTAAYEPVDHGRPVEAALRLLREGGPAGLCAVVTGDRGALTSRLAAVAGRRLLLRLADPADYALAGVASRQVPARLPPGRGVLAGGGPTGGVPPAGSSTGGVLGGGSPTGGTTAAGTGLEVQVALLDPDPGGAAQRAALHRLATEVRDESAGARRPLRVEPLPTRVHRAALRAGRPDGPRTSTPTTAGSPLRALVGVGGDELDPVEVDLAADGPAFLVSGPPGSRRSTAARTLATSLADGGAAVVVVAPRRSPLHDLAGVPGVRAALLPTDAARLGELLGHPGPLVVVVDDAEDVTDSAVEPLLAALLRAPADPPRALVLAGDGTALATGYRGVAAEARRGRFGLQLCPTGLGDADLLGVRVPRADEPRPGRGVLVVRGRMLPVQVALP